MLFPEALARIYMAVNDVTFDEANEAVHKKHVDNDLEEEPKVRKKIFVVFIYLIHINC